MTDGEKTEVALLVSTINSQMENFVTNAEKVTNKSAARRARKISMHVTDLMKKYRKFSIK